MLTHAPEVDYLEVITENLARRRRVTAERADYAIPILWDERARLANELGADYASYTVLVDREGRVHYRGGIDSDKMTIHPDSTHFVQDALDDVLAGRPTRRPEGKTLGCVLRKW